MTIETVAQDQFVTLNGLRVHYREWGAQDAPDLHGHRETDWAPDYSAASLIDDTEQLAAHLHQPHFSLIGHSLGATVAYRYAARYPDRVVRLVIGDIGPDIFSTPLVEAELARFRSIALEVCDNREEAVNRAVAAADPTTDGASEALRARLAYGFVQGTDGRWRRRHDAAGLGAKPQARREVETADWAALAQIRCPTLVVRGASSPVLSRENAERMVRTVADCRWAEVPSSGHDVPGDNLAGYLAAVGAVPAEAGRIERAGATAAGCRLETRAPVCEAQRF